MIAAQVFSEQQVDGRSAMSDAIAFVSDEVLVAAAKMGHAPAFNELHKRHAERILWVAQRITRHREDAEDAVQEAFLSAYLHIKSFDERARFETWLTRIAINAALMKVRRNRKSREVPLENPAKSLNSDTKQTLETRGQNPEEICAKSEREATLRDAIGKLRPSLRNAVELYQLQELSLHETAKALGISAAAAKGRLFHARAALRGRKELKAVRSRNTLTSKNCSYSPQRTRRVFPTCVAGRRGLSGGLDQREDSNTQVPAANMANKGLGRFLSQRQFLNDCYREE
jgi:RNA polymerase sigma factor (sigma-70 family)